MNNKKIIGIPGWSLGENSFGVTKPYLDFISKHLGGMPRIIMPGEEMLPELDLLILPGGLDVDATSYGEAPGFYNSSIDPYKQWFFNKRLEQYIENKTAIFGICLGFQQLNVVFGGSLVQNLHYHEQSSDRWKAGHEIKITQIGRLFYPSREKQKYEVNSHHHQAVLVNTLGDGLRIVATAKNNDQPYDADTQIVEAFVHESLPIAGVQYHPEEWRDVLSYNMITMIMERAKDKVPMLELQ